MNKVLIITKYTFLEILKSKIVFYVGLSGVMLSLVTFIAQEFTYGVPTKIVMDFGLGLSSLSSIGVAIFLGVSLLSREIEQRTVYMVLARPVTRSQFLIGRILGLMVIQLINTILLGGVTLTLFVLMGGKLTPIIFWANLFIFLESVLILQVVILFSLISNPILAVINSLVLLVCGHFVNDSLLTTFAQSHGSVKLILDAYVWIFPAFYKLNLKDYVLYQNTCSTEVLLWGLAYCICYSLFLMGISNIIFINKNID